MLCCYVMSMVFICLYTNLNVHFPMQNTEMGIGKRVISLRREEWLLMAM